MEKRWYKEAVVYQIYPRSFKDNNGDGYGDLKGIISKLEYVKSLGVDVIWLSPIYASPMDDNGYDISDYLSINKEFGTMEDFNEMITKIHSLGMKLIMDLVINHTSDEHKWFQEALKDKNSKYRDYYFFKKGKKGKLPNNWRSFFGGCPWEKVGEDEYYLHLFSKKQPDLNWDNPEVRSEIKNILKFWLDKGVDGFRCDVINIISKKEGLPNGKKDLLLTGKEQYLNGPHIHEYLQEINREVFDNYDMFTVGEGCFITPNVALSYEKPKEINMFFQFDHMSCDSHFVKWFVKKLKLKNLKKALTKWQYALNGEGWNTLYFENHDQPRSISRFGNETYREKTAKMLATFLFFEQGTPFIYQGQEIGMTNPHFKNLDDYQDVETHTIYEVGRKQFKFSHKFMMKRIEFMSRDNARTPMQWDNSENAGFTKGTPWLKVNKNYQEVNVEKDLKNENSIFKYYQNIISLRKKYPVIVYGDYFEYYQKSNKMVMYKRSLDNDVLLVVCNYTDKDLQVKYPKEFSNYQFEEVLLDNYDSKEFATTLKPYEAIVYLYRK